MSVVSTRTGVSLCRNYLAVAGSILASGASAPQTAQPGGTAHDRDGKLVEARPPAVPVCRRSGTLVVQRKAVAMWLLPTMRLRTQRVAMPGVQVVGWSDTLALGGRRSTSNGRCCCSDDAQLFELPDRPCHDPGAVRERREVPLRLCPAGVPPSARAQCWSQTAEAASPAAVM